MSEYEYVGNLHAHTRYSDGWASHEGVARAALAARLDFVVTTDHNVWVRGVEGYYHEGSRRVLLLTGEEVHDSARDPQKNHLLVYAATEEMAPWAAQPQRLVDSVRRHGGLSFLAHPVDPPAPLFHEPDLSWVDWDIRGFTGIEIWNFMSQYKGWLQSWPGALLASLFPDWFLQGPFAPILRLWDENLTAGRPLVAIGSADAHGLPIAWGPFRRVIFPYEYLFRAINTHVLCPDSWTGRSEDDAARLYSSLRTGSCFVANDRAASSRGFRFSATDDQGIVPMGGSARARFGVTFQIRTPRPAHLRMIRNGVLLKQWPQAESAVLTAHDPGAYRVEAHLTRTGRRRPWIYSNAIHVAP